MKLKSHKNISLIHFLKLLYSMDIKLLWQTAIYVSKYLRPVSRLDLGWVCRSHCVDKIESLGA